MWFKWSQTCIFKVLNQKLTNISLHSFKEENIFKPFFLPKQPLNMFKFWCQWGIRQGCTLLMCELHSSKPKVSSPFPRCGSYWEAYLEYIYYLRCDASSRAVLNWINTVVEGLCFWNLSYSFSDNLMIMLLPEMLQNSKRVM